MEEAGQFSSYFLWVKMSVPEMVVLTAPLLFLVVVASETRQGKPLSMQ